MASPILSIASVSYLGRRVMINGNCVFAGAVTMEYYIVSDTGESFGPYPIPPVVNNFFNLLGPVSPGRWGFRIVAKPDDGTESAELVTEVRTLTRAIGRSVMPLYHGDPTVSPANNSIKFDPLTRSNYRAYTLGGAVGTRRSAAATSISNAFGNNSVLRIYRNNREIVHVEYLGRFTTSIDANGDVFLVPPPVKASTIIQAADLSSGNWRFVIQGGPGLAREIHGTVGPAESSSHIVLAAAPEIGMGFKGDIKFLFPRSIDGLN